MPRRASILLALVLGLSVLVPADAQAMWAERTFYQLLQKSDDVLVVHVDSTGGPRYGEWAQVSVERSMKGTVQDDTLRLPFAYETWASFGGGRVSVSTAFERTFESGQRLLVLVTRRPLPDTTGSSRFGNPFAAETRYRVYRYPSDTQFHLGQSDVPIVWAVERLLQAGRAESPAAQADALRPLVEHERPRIRRYAAGAARELAPDPLAPLLLRRFERETDRRVHRRVTEALARLTHPEITPTLLDAAPTSRSALRALERRADPAARPPLMDLYEALADTAADPVQRVLHTLDNLVTPADVPRLLQWYRAAETTERRKDLLRVIAATDSERGTAFLETILTEGTPPSLRAQVADLARWDSLDALGPALLGRFEEEPNAEVRRTIAETLGELGHPKGIQLLLNAAPTYRPALQALSRPMDTTLAAPLIRMYDAIADTTGPRTRRALRIALATHVSAEHDAPLVRRYRSAPSPEQKRLLLSLIGPLATPTSDSLLANVLKTEDTPSLRLVAAQLMGKRDTHFSSALAQVLQNDESPRVRMAAFRALGERGDVSALDDVVAHAPPPCAVTDESGLFASAWQTITGWIWGGSGRGEPPWTPDLFFVVRELGRANVENPQPVTNALVPYLACQQFDEVPILAAKTLFALDPVAARPVLRNRLAQDPTPRVRETLRHLVWVSSQIDSS